MEGVGPDRGGLAVESPWFIASISFSKNKTVIGREEGDEKRHEKGWNGLLGGRKADIVVGLVGIAGEWSVPAGDESTQTGSKLGPHMNFPLPRSPAWV